MSGTNNNCPPVDFLKSDNQKHSSCFSDHVWNIMNDGRNFENYSTRWSSWTASRSTDRRYDIQDCYIVHSWIFTFEFSREIIHFFLNFSHFFIPGRIRFFHEILPNLLMFEIVPVKSQKCHTMYREKYVPIVHADNPRKVRASLVFASR